MRKCSHAEYYEANKFGKIWEPKDIIWKDKLPPPGARLPGHSMKAFEDCLTCLKDAQHGIVAAFVADSGFPELAQFLEELLRVLPYGLDFDLLFDCSSGALVRLLQGLCGSFSDTGIWLILSRAVILQKNAEKLNISALPLKGKLAVPPTVVARVDITSIQQRLLRAACADMDGNWRLGEGRRPFAKSLGAAIFYGLADARSLNRGSFRRTFL
jgi:hypothetical protein